MTADRRSNGVAFLELWRRIDRYSLRTRGMVMAVFLAIGVGADAITGPDVSMLLVYSVAVAGTAWFVGRRTSVVFAVLAGVATAMVQGMTDEFDVPSGIVALNALFRTLSLGLLALVVVHQRRLVVMLRDASITDSLTGVLNRAGAMQRLGHELERSRRTGAPLSVAYLDLDGLKERNDRLGHAAGDELIVQLARATMSTLRSIDSFGRMGGDEFLVVLSDTDVVGARSTLERLFALDDLPAVSVGMLCFGRIPSDLAADDVIRRVDEVMYTAKRSEPVASGVDGEGSVAPNRSGGVSTGRKWRIVEA